MSDIWDFVIALGYSELNCDYLFICVEHLLYDLVYIASVLLILTYYWQGSWTMFKWYLGLYFNESPIFDYLESNQVVVRVVCLCTWIFAMCLVFYRCLANHPKKKGIVTDVSSSPVAKRTRLSSQSSKDSNRERFKTPLDS